MYAIASLLDPTADRWIRGIWERFETHCGLTGIRSTPLPHFSWQAAERYQEEAVEGALTEAAKSLPVFSVQASGLGLFTGARPVVYVALVKDQHLLELHQQLWETLHPLAFGSSGYYAPKRWMPHITLAFRELDSDRLACAVDVIAFERIEFEIQVDNLALIYSNNGEAGIHCHVPLKGGEKEEAPNAYSRVASRSSAK